MPAGRRSDMLQPAAVPRAAGFGPFYAVTFGGLSPRSRGRYMTGSMLDGSCSTVALELAGTKSCSDATNRHGSQPPAGTPADRAPTLGARANPHGWVEGLAVQTGVGSKAQSICATSASRGPRRECVGVDFGQGATARHGDLLDLFVRAPLDGTCASRRHEHEAAVRELFAWCRRARIRGGMLPALNAINEQTPKTARGRAGVGLGGTERRPQRQPGCTGPRKGAGRFAQSVVCREVGRRELFKSAGLDGPASCDGACVV